MPPEELTLEAELLKALGHPVRLRVLRLLAAEERCVCDLMSAIGIEQSNLSQHLKLLRKHGIVDARRDGSRVVYRLVNREVLLLLNGAQRAVQQYLDRMGALAANRLRR